MTCPDFTLAHAEQAPCSKVLRGAPGGAGADPLIGCRLGGYRVLRRLGRGGMGTVYLAEHPELHSKVAVKLLHAHFSGNPALVKRFRDEARAVNLIRNENILEIFDMSVAPDGRCYLLMEYLDGHPLSRLTVGPVEPSVAIPILSQLCAALTAAHSCGVVHRDLKPENIFLVRRRGEEHFVKLLDFGVAKLLSPEEDDTPDAVVGTPEFMAPEQLQAGPIDGRADLYAVGIIAYVLATGHLPFRGATAHETMKAQKDRKPEPPELVHPPVPHAWSQVILRALQKRPDARFATALEMKSALERVLAPRA